MGQATLRAMIEECSSRIEIVFQRQGEVRPMWHCVTSEGEEMAMAPPPFLSKDLAVTLMQAFFELKDVVRYVFVNEAWILQMTVDSDEAAASLARVNEEGLANHPDRIEVVMFAGEDENGMLTAQRVIERPAGRKPRLGPLEFPDLTGVRSEGRMVGLLPQRGTVQ